VTVPISLATSSVNSLSGTAGRRTRLGLSSRRCRHHCATARARGGPCGVRVVPLWGPLVRGGHRIGPCHPTRCWRTQASHPPVPLGPSLCPQSVCHRLRGNVRAALFMAAPHQARQYQARGIPRHRAAHTDRWSRAQHA